MSKRRFAFFVAMILGTAFLPGQEATAGTIKVKLYLSDGITELATSPYATATVTSAVSQIVSSVKINATTVQATTLQNHGFIAGNLVKINNCSAGGNNGDNLTILSASGKIFTYTCITTTGGSTGGNATMYFVRAGTPYKSGDPIVVNTVNAFDKSVTLNFQYAGGVTILDGIFGNFATDMNISVVLPAPGEILHGFSLGTHTTAERHDGGSFGDGSITDCGCAPVNRCRRGNLRSRCR